MKRRIRLNGREFEAEFRERYESLYRRCSHVVSVSSNFYWCGEHVVLHGGPAMLQKIPVRAHIGLERLMTQHSRGKVTCSHWEYRQPLSGELIQEPIPMGPRTRMERVLSDVVTEIAGGRTGFDLVVHLLLEFPTGCGLNSSGAISAGLAVALYTLLGGLDGDVVTKWQTQELSKLIRDKTFDAVFRTAWKIELAIHGGVSSGAGAFVPFISSKYPVLFCTEERRGTLSSRVGSYAPVSVGTEYDEIDKVSYWAERFENLVGIGDVDWPLDFGLLFSGTVKYTAEATDSVVKLRDERAEASAEMLFKIVDYVGFKDLLLHGWMSKVKGDEGFTERDAYESWCKQLMEYGSALALEAMWYLARAFKMRSPSSVRRLMESLNDFQRFLSVAGASNFDIDLLAMETRRFVKLRDPRAEAAVKVSGSGQSGDLVFVVPRGELVGQTEKLSAYLDECNPAQSVQVDYLSWRDGIGGGGACVEQAIPDIHSAYVPPETLFVLAIGAERSSVARAFDVEDIEDAEEVVKEYDIVANLSEPEQGRVFIGGEEMTSAELKTSKCTARLLYKIAMHPDEAIESEEIAWIVGSSESYADESGFRRTIVTYLKKAVKERMGCNLRISVSNKGSGGGFKVIYGYSSRPSIAVIVPPKFCMR